MKFTKVRSTVPLSEADFAAIRDRVLADIRHPQRPARVTWIYAFAAVALLLIGLSVLLTARRPMPMPVGVPRQRPVVTVAAPPAPAVTQAAMPVRHPKSRKSPPRSAALHAQVRMEIHTSDPDVRIIWIAR